jgi:predicted nucleic acid-binding protein
MTFVDTSAWFSAYVPTDPFYHRMRTILFGAGRLVTTDYVLDETLTLKRTRGHFDRALHFGPHILEQRVTVLEYVKSTDVAQAWIEFSRFRDKAWSFTDCTSYVVMKRLSITNAVSLDDHFRQMPGIAVATIAP